MRLRDCRDCGELTEPEDWCIKCRRCIYCCVCDDYDDDELGIDPEEEADAGIPIQPSADSESD